MIEPIARGLFGIIILLGFCYLLSNHRSGINWRLIGGGIALQVVLAMLLLATPFSGVI